MEYAAAHRRTDGGEKQALYVVATPIGNLRDITLRALDVLKGVAVVAAEDTRVTAKLLSHYGIAARLVALNEHNEKRVVPRVLKELAAGGSVALVSDAGTPGISDPGALLVSAVRAAGYTVTPLPGANAAAAALSVSGFSTPHFLFCGFLPARPAARRAELARLATYPFALVFFEAPHRVAESVSDMRTLLGAERRIVIARELTKLFETVHACRLGEAPDWLAADEHRRRGEFVLVVEPGAPRDADEAGVQRLLEALLAELPLARAVALTTRITGARRNALYALALKLREGAGAQGGSR